MTIRPVTRGYLKTNVMELQNQDNGVGNLELITSFHDYIKITT